MLAFTLYRAARHLPTPLDRWAAHAYASLRERVYQAEVLPGLVVTQGAPRSNSIWEDRLSSVGGHERGVCEWLAENLRPDDVLYDVGAHYGFFPLLAATVQPTARVHAFEPDPYPLPFLRRNEARSPSTTPWSIIEKRVGREENKFTVTLDGYAARTIAPTIVKMDIEGAEVLATAGAQRLIESREVDFLIEIHPEQIEAMGSSIDAMLEQFPADYRRKVLVDIRSHDTAVWTDDLTALFTDDHPYVYLGPPETERTFRMAEETIPTA
ncbi:MAG: hypothetical protein AAF488_10995 [Planctomycetota bacterium]